MIPDYVYKDLLKTTKDKLLIKAIKNSLALSKKLRNSRFKLLGTSNGTCERFVHTMGQKTENLPGVLAMKEGDQPSIDREIKEAYDWSGVVRDFYSRVLGLNSIDNSGHDLISSCHYDKDYDNAFWNGEQMVYGDGKLFLPLTRDLNVAAHEMGHGFVQNTADLVYWYEPGALNEHYADVLGICTKHWYKKSRIKDSVWLIGEEIVSSAFPGKAIRSFKNEKAYSSDPQPKHASQRNWFMFEDNMGVHILSGLPNRVFYEFCVLLQDAGICEYSWEAPLMIWVDTLKNLHRFSTFGSFKSEVLKQADSRKLKSYLEQAFEIVGM